MKLTAKQEEALLERISEDYEFAKAERDRHIADWADDRAQYDCEWTELQLEEDEDIREWFYVPKTRTIIHRLECTFQQHFFPGGLCKMAKVLPVTMEGMRPLAARLLDQVLHAKVDIDLRPIRQYSDSFETALIEGQAVLQMSWQNWRGQNRPVLYHRPNEHVCWDPYAYTPDQIEFFCVEMWLTAEELRRRGQQGFYDKGAVEDVIDRGESDDIDETWKEEVVGPENKQWERYKIVEYWGPQHVSAGEYQTPERKLSRGLAPDIVASVFADEVLLRVKENPWAKLLKNAEPGEKLPFRIMTMLPKRNSTYGHSLVRWVRALQREVNLKRNYRVLAILQELTRKIAVDSDRGGDLDLWRDAKYCGIIPVDGDPNKIVKDFAPQTSTQQILQEETMLDSELQELTGVTDYHYGSSGPGQQKTATGVSIVTEEGNAKQDTLLANAAMSGVIPVMRWFAAACVQYVKPDEVQKIIGSRTPPPPLKDVLEDDWSIELEAGPSAASKATRMRELQYATQAYGQIANAAPQVAIPALMELTQETMRLLGLGHVGGMAGAQSPQGQNAGAMPSVAGALGNPHQMMQPENTGRMPQRA